MSTATLEFVAEQLGRLVAAVNELKNGIGTLEAKVGALDTKVGTLEAEVGALVAKIDGFETKIGALEAKVGALEAEVGTLAARLDTLEGGVRALRAGHEELDRRVRDMTADGQITLAFLARQIERLLDEQGRLRDDTTVLTGMVMRLEGTVQGLTVEVRGEHSRYDRLAREVARLREMAPS